MEDEWWSLAQVASKAKGNEIRQAKLDLLKEFGDQALPIYWAGFTLVGDGSKQSSSLATHL